MRTILLLLGLLLSITATARTYVCDQMNLPSMKGATYFSSERPLLINKIAYFDSDGDLLTTHEVTLISESNICGTPLHFGHDCQTQEVETQNTYHYSFSCEAYHLKGGFYVDHQGLGRFRCETPDKTQTAIAGDCNDEM